MQKMVLSCKKAAELTDKKLMGQLSFMESIQLGVHRLICTCSICGKYESHSKLLDQKITELKATHEPMTMTLSQKEEIIKTVVKGDE